MTNTTSSKSEFDIFYQELNSLHPLFRSLLRSIASAMLRSYNLPEIGSSDVSCEVFNIWKRMGGFNNENFFTSLTELRDEWLGWASLPDEQ